MHKEGSTCHEDFAAELAGVFLCLAFWASEAMRVRAIPMPSMIASRKPPTTADLKAVRGPCRSCRKPPAKAPAAIEFQGSSLPRIPNSVQSATAKHAPQPAKLPPTRGACTRIPSIKPRTLERRERDPRVGSSAVKGA